MTDPIDMDRTNPADDDEDRMPCPGALLAGTLALMTAWADPCGNAHCTAARQRHLMARKIVSNLFFLKEHPQVAPMLRNVMANAHRRWVLVAASVEEGKVSPCAGTGAACAAAPRAMPASSPHEAVERVGPVPPGAVLH